MESRLKLHEKLVEIIGQHREKQVYFQPPTNTKLTYPCIVYSRTEVTTDHADNNPYSRVKRYSVTVIDRDPDSPLPDKVGVLSGASFAQHFTNDGLNHDVFNVHTQNL